MATTMDQSVASGVHADAMDNQQRPDPEVPERPRPRSYSARYKAEILAEYERLDKAGKGALLRREGLYTSLLSEWRKQRDPGSAAGAGHPAGTPAGRPGGAGERAAASGEPAPGRRAGQGPQGHRGPGKLSALLEQLATDSAPPKPTGGEQQ